MTSRVSGVVKWHPIITFFVLTYAITWGFLPFGSFGDTLAFLDDHLGGSSDRIDWTSPPRAKETR